MSHNIAMQRILLFSTFLACKLVLPEQICSAPPLFPEKELQVEGVIYNFPVYNQ